jgi:hypothetical protein
MVSARVNHLARPMNIVGLESRDRVRHVLATRQDVAVKATGPTPSMNWLYQPSFIGESFTGVELSPSKIQTRSTFGAQRRNSTPALWRTAPKRMSWARPTSLRRSAIAAACCLTVNPITIAARSSFWWRMALAVPNRGRRSIRSYCHSKECWRAERATGGSVPSE